MQTRPEFSPAAFAAGQRRPMGGAEIGLVETGPIAIGVESPDKCVERVERAS
jgi:hypothetical protein